MAQTNGIVEDQYTEIFDEGHGMHRDGVNQRIRANSSIMELKKILGMKLPFLKSN